MILVDSSAWIEYLRATGSPADREVDRLLDSTLVTTEPIVMEILAGGRSDQHLRELRGLLGRAEMAPVLNTDYDVAASMVRTCRQHGETVRKLVDCLIGAVAIRRDLPVLHADGDFEALARWTSLTVHRF